MNYRVDSCIPNQHHMIIREADRRFLSYKKSHGCEKECFINTREETRQHYLITSRHPSGTLRYNAIFYRTKSRLKKYKRIDVYLPRYLSV